MTTIYTYKFYIEITPFTYLRSNCVEIIGRKFSNRVSSFIKDKTRQPFERNFAHAQNIYTEWNNRDAKHKSQLPTVSQNCCDEYV